ncbi:MAG: ubiquinone/menaquinone biosynthesis methyltransferase [Verrucomicrobia bacterium]|nr:ubiquinone/menaquinone biosynthesis methyltransferase [Verrucomicrobiota bacterium]
MPPTGGWRAGASPPTVASVSRYYVEGEARAERVGDLFAAVAPRYDLINDLQSFGLHRLWKRRLLRLAEVRPGTQALDVCCGTGDVAFALARAGAITTGFDFSAPMLAVARKRAGGWREAAKAPEFLQGDALALPFPDASFDVVTISYGLRNLANLDRGLRELLRVLRPGGRLLILDFGKPDWAPWRWLYLQYLRWGVPVFGRLFCGDADTHGYILESLQHYPAQRGVDTRLRALGCSETRIIQLLGGVMSINVAQRHPGSRPPSQVG